MNKVFKYIYAISSVFLVSPVFAQEPPRLSEGFVATAVDNVLGYLFPIAGILAVAFVVYGGYMWIISAGDPSRVKQAQGTLTWAILGLVFVMVILGLLQLLVNFISK